MLNKVFGLMNVDLTTCILACKKMKFALKKEMKTKFYVIVILFSIESWIVSIRLSQGNYYDKIGNE